MAKWVLVALAVGMFVFAVLAYVRGESLVAAERQRIAADNAARQREATGPVLLEVDPDVGKLQADAFLRGELWFLVTPVAWAVFGAVFLAAAAAVALLLRKRRPAAGD